MAGGSRASAARISMSHALPPGIEPLDLQTQFLGDDLSGLAIGKPMALDKEGGMKFEGKEME